MMVLIARAAVRCGEDFGRLRSGIEPRLKCDGTDAGKIAENVIPCVVV
jgi:hypothetical protein